MAENSTSISGPFVGRQEQLKILGDHLECACEGKTRFTVVSGEPGIGKTRLTEVIAEQAGYRNMLTVIGRCADYEYAPTYWPFIKATNQLAEMLTVDELVESLGNGAAIIAETIPGVREALPSVQPPRTLEPQQHRFLFFDAYEGFLRRLSSHTPTLLILENLHWVDKGSLLLLEYLCEELRNGHLLVVGTYRDTEINEQSDLSISLGQMAREPGFCHLRLPRLREHEVIELVTGLTEGPSDPAFTKSVFRRTEGNPLYIHQMVRFFVHSETEIYISSQLSERPPLPEPLKLVIYSRLNRLGNVQRRIIEAAAILGKSFSLDMLSKILEATGIDADHTSAGSSILDIIEELCSNGILEASAKNHNEYRFSHSLFREALLENMPVSRNRLLRCTTARLLEYYYGPKAADHAAELSDHFQWTTDPEDVRKLYAFSAVAGQAAFSRYNYEEAIIHLQRAYRAAEELGVPMDNGNANINFQLGLAFGLELRSDDSDRHLDIAFSFWESKGDYESMMRVVNLPLWAFDMMYMWAWDTRPVSPWSRRTLKYCRKKGLERLILEAEAELGGDASVDTLTDLETTLAEAFESEGDTVDIVVRLRVLKVLTKIQQDTNSRSSYSNHFERLLPAVDVSPDPWLRISAHFDIIRSLISDGRPADIAPHLDVAIDLAGRLKDRPKLVALLLERAIHQVDFHHDLTEACKILRKALGIDPQNVAVKSMLAHYSLTLGECSLAANLLDEVEAAMRNGLPSKHNAKLLACRMLWDRERLWEYTGDRTGLDAAARRAWKAMPYMAEWLTRAVLTSLGLIALQDGKLEEATKHVYWLEKNHMRYQADINLPPPYRLGRMMHGIGRLDAAHRFFELVLSEDSALKDRPRIEIRLWYARMLVERRDQGDLKKARELVEEGICIAERVGAKPLLTMLYSLKARIDPAGRLPDNLTSREGEVLRLIAQGLTNSEIGESLFISPNTVMTHVRNIFSKIGASNRAEAAAYTMRSGLMGVKRDVH